MIKRLTFSITRKVFVFFLNPEKIMKGSLDVDVNVACAVFSEV